MDTGFNFRLRGDAPMDTAKWHTLSCQDLAKEYNSDLQKGLTHAQADLLLQKYGKNRLEEKKPPSLLLLFLSQFNDVLVLILLLAGSISFFLGEVVDSITIAAILVLNAFFGFFQEYKAEQSLKALRRLSAPKAKVLREGTMISISAEDIVPGDIMLVEGGDRITADARLIWSVSLEVDESLLTGESVPISKDYRYIGTAHADLAERKNMLHTGTMVTKGRGKALVVGTGMHTQIGEIASLISNNKQDSTPLQHRLEQLGKGLVLACSLLVLAVFLAGVLRGIPVYRMFLTSVSLAVAAIPEGLPAVVTAALALGVQRMIKRNAIIRKLPAVETLGCATVICTDKTGTLTKNEMTVSKIYTLAKEYDLTGTGYDPQGAIMYKGVKVSPDEDLLMALQIGAVCNSSSVTFKAGNEVSKKAAEKGQISGDPTEAALIIAAMKGGLVPDSLNRSFELISEQPFDSEKRFMSVVVSHRGKIYSMVKGAPDTILDRCSEILINGKAITLSGQLREKILQTADSYAQNALRVLALAYKSRSEETDNFKAPDMNLRFVALTGMFDPPREEVKAAIVRSRKAGIRTIMVTGDHPYTAMSIGSYLGLADKGEKPITGKEIESLSAEELKRIVRVSNCYARVSPKHKLSIVRALKENGEIVAMTGDGVNDAPAVKEADIGISMGKNGTEVTKEASDMVLADDNYATIVAAIEEGRAIYDNIRKFIRYLLSCNAGEVMVMLVAVLAGLPLPLLPIQILWMNLVTDGLPAIALGVDPPEKGIMQRAPRLPKAGIFAGKLSWKITISGLFIGVCTLASYIYGLYSGLDITKARTIAFTTLVMSQLAFAFRCRSDYRSSVEVGIGSNPFLLVAVSISALMQLAVVYLSPMMRTFQTQSLTWADWVVVLICSGSALTLDFLIYAFKNLVLPRFSMVKVTQPE
jgi:Ca2+-transporting ATPase